MSSGMMPEEHMHTLLKEAVPAFRYDGKEDWKAWQMRARARLSRLLGIDRIEPYRTNPAVCVESDRVSEEDGYREIRFTVATEESVTVPCHLLQPLGAAAPRPTVICLQGHSTGMHISLGRAKFPGDEQTIHGGDRDFAVRAVKEGVCAVAVEQRCFGECGGTEKGPNCRQAAMRALLLGRTLVGERVWDIMRVIDAMEARFADIVDPRRILCLGNSGGGTATVYASALEERIAVAVPSCAVSTYADSIGAMLHCECNFIPGIAEDFDMGDLLGLIAPRPVIVVSGRDDPIFPIVGAKACVAEGAKVYRAAGVTEYPLHIVGEGGHRFYADNSWGSIHEAILHIR